MKRYFRIAALLLALAPRSAIAQNAVAQQAPETKTPPLAALHGYLQPQFGFRYRPSALLRDRWEYGALSSRAGLIVSGEPVTHWFYTLHLSLDAEQLSVITGVNLVDVDGDGNADSVDVTRRSAIGTLFEEVSVSYQPANYFLVKAGAMRMPFTVGASSANTALMFPTRAGANDVFQKGSDQGLLMQGQWPDGRISASLGLFNGSSLGLIPNTVTARGLLYSARIDAAPLGTMPPTENDFARLPFRFGIGMGGLYRNGTLYSPTGYELTEHRDLRLSASLRVAWQGFYLQAEGLRRVETDNLSSRPNMATGGYVQSSFFFLVSPFVGLSPIGRAGYTVTDEVTLPRKVVYLEGGLALFPRADLPRPDTVRVLIQYQGENRITDGENAHGLVGQVQLLF